MVRLSVNINKVALLRNARGANYPDLIEFAQRCEDLGAQGITVHPRPDERHIRFNDLLPLKKVVKTEFNIEGYPSPEFIQRIMDVQPDQVTLVPDAPGALTSDSGWDTIKHQDFLIDVIAQCKDAGCRVSLFLNPEVELVKPALTAGADRIELYTGEYARSFGSAINEEELQKHIDTASLAVELGLGVNAGHDLNTDNLPTYVKALPQLLEVSIGHALVVDALEYGLRNTILMYLKACAI